MRSYIIMRYVGMVLLLNAAFMLVSVGVSLLNNLDTGFYPLLMSFLLTAAIGFFPMIFVPRDFSIKIKESYVIVVASWAACCVTGMIPYLLWGGEFNLHNAWFESVSGYTTTGSTILSDVEALPKGILFWRSCTHLIGGAGVVMFALAIMPAMGRAKFALSNVEFSALTKDNYSYKIHKALRVLLVVYIFLITAETILLNMAGMSWFDAMNHSFSTIATGGFSTKNTSIAYFNNIWIEVIIAVFMFLSGMHFGVLFSSIQAKRNNIFRSEVPRFYTMTIIVCTILVTINLFTNDYYTFFESIRYAGFQVLSLITTTGFATTDTNIWPALSILILIYISIQCACAGSTAGGIKTDRIFIMLKAFRSKFSQMQHTNAVVHTRLNNNTISQDLIHSVFVFSILYIIVIILGTLTLTAMGIDLITSFSASFTCLGNVGPGFGQISSLSTFNELPSGAKYVLTIIMLLGRLELFGFIQIFLLKSWR